MNFIGGIFGIIGNLLGSILMLFLELTKNYGIAVILFTLFIKIILIPFEIKNRKSQVGTVRLSKKRAELEKRYSKDKMKLNQELNKLYEKEEVNPMGGCATMLLPLFMLFGVMAAVGSPLTNTFHFPEETVNSAIEVVKENPEIDNLSNSHYQQIEVFSAFIQRPDAFDMFSEEQVNTMEKYSESFNFLGMNLLDVPKSSSFESMLWIVPVLSFVASIFMSFLMQKSQTMLQPGSMKGCMTVSPYLMNLWFLWIVFGTPVAVGIYWTMNAVLGTIQYLFLNKYYSVEMIVAKQEAARIALRLQEESQVSRKV